MNHWGIDLRRAAPLALLLAAMACGQGGGGCGPMPDADKVAAEAKKGKDSSKNKSGAAADAAVAKGEGYKPGAYANSLSGFGAAGESSSGGLAGSPKSEFARLAKSLPPTPENLKIITSAMGPDAARGGPKSSADLAGNGGYVTVDTSKGEPTWQWHSYDSGHAAPAGFEKPYVPSGPAAAPAPPSDASSPMSGAPPGFKGCWPKPPPLNHIDLSLMGGNGNRRVVDSTPIVCSRGSAGGYCQTVMKDPARGCCPLRPEGDPMRVVCEAEVMGKDSDGRSGPRWTFKGNGSVEKQPSNPYLAWGYGDGWVGACSNLSPICNWIEVKNGTTGAAGAPGSSSPSSPPSSSPPATSPPGTTPKPSPAPAPPPSSAHCLLPMGPDNYLDMVVELQGTAFGQALNLTPRWCGDPANMPPAGYHGRCGTKCCILGVDGGPMGRDCERALVGTPQWTGTEPFAENPFLAHPHLGARVCSQFYPQFCGQAR